MGAGLNDFLVELVNSFGDLGCTAASYFLNRCNAMLFVTRIDAFRRVPTEKILVKNKATYFFKNWDTDFLSTAWVYS